MQAQLTMGGRMLSLSGEQLDELLVALAQLDGADARSVGEEIAALRVAGGVIRLTPTTAELSAVERAMAHRRLPPSGSS